MKRNFRVALQQNPKKLLPPIALHHRGSEPPGALETPADWRHADRPSGNVTEGPTPSLRCPLPCDRQPNAPTVAYPRDANPPVFWGHNRPFPSIRWFAYGVGQFAGAIVTSCGEPSTGA